MAGLRQHVKDAVLLRQKGRLPSRTDGSRARFPRVVSAAIARAQRSVLWLFAAACIVVGHAGTVRGQAELPAPEPSSSITITAAQGQRWMQGQTEVWLLEGDCVIAQGDNRASGNEAVVWVREEGEIGERVYQVTVYLEGNVALEYRREGGRDRLTDQRWLGVWQSSGNLEVRVSDPGGEPSPKPPVFERALAQRTASRTSAITRTEVQRFAMQTEPAASAEPTPLAPGTRRLRAFPRSAVPFSVESFQNQAGNEWVTIIDRGVTLIVEGLGEVGQLDISADRIVIWRAGSGQLDLSGAAIDDAGSRLELYMEGNLVFRQGQRVIYADRMFYDVNAQVGTVLSAEVLSPVPNFQGLVRLKADLIKQTGSDRFLAERAYVTTSRFARPGFRLQSGLIEYEDVQRPLIEPRSGLAQLDPETGEQLYDRQQRVTGRNNTLFLSQLPVFYWPRFSTTLEEPTFYLRRIRFKSDKIFGQQIYTDWDAFQLLGLRNRPAGTDLNLSLDYLSQRGFGVGPTLRYSRSDLFGIPGPYTGFFDGWYIHDGDDDNLGNDRLVVPTEADDRYRLLWRHRHRLPGDWQLTAELGKSSDRNFLEAFYEKEWDEFKDQSTGIELKRLRDNRSLSIWGDVRLNDFLTTTEWLPRGDHFWLGQPLLGEWLTWSEHTNVGYGRMRVASPPTNPVDILKFQTFPWEATVDGVRLASRHEVSLPFGVGPMKAAVYGLGEAAYWGEDLAFGDTTRLYGQAGIRASVPFWNVNPNIESALFNVHGISHKMLFHADFGYSDANQDLDDLPLYDALDDDNLEQYRRRFAFNTFGGAVPLRFDPRNYALRSGLGGNVSSSTTEIADDLMALRFGLNQRWQTKRGLPENRRIIDWMVLDARAVYFPRPDQDNFGQEFGLVNYDYRWHVGDRLTLLSSGLYDFFDQGGRVTTVGGFLNRPPRGSLHVGFRSLEGPIKSQVLSATYSYRMSPKWVTALGTSVDVGGNGNIGQYASLARIGESLLFVVGFNVDASKGVFGANFSIEPRFMPLSRLGQMVGARLPVSGATGLE